MQLNPKKADVTLDAFHASWNLDRIKKMSLKEYAHLKDHDSLCFWLEYGTKALGAIGGIALHKFEIWETIDDKNFKDNRFKRQDGYAWSRKKGETLSEAFKEIRRLATEVVVKSMAGDWEAVERIPFHAIGKWKLAFLFSNKRLLPVYSRRALLAISNGVRLGLPANSPIFKLQEGILEKKPKNEDVVDYSYWLYDRYARERAVPNYYLIGSKYGNNDEIDVMKDFVAGSCVAMGWIWDKSFSKLMGASDVKVNAWVTKYWKEAKPELGKIKGYFRLFSRIKAGDIIAVKSHGRFNKLKIIGYAQVVEREGSVYWFDKDNLSHHIHVEFLDAAFLKNFEYTYAGTIHQLTPEKKSDAFYDIFNWYAESSEDITADPEPEVSVDDDDTGYNAKGEEDYERGAVGSTTVKRIHNKIQNRFIKYLKQNYPGDACSGEKRYIDAKRITKSEYIIYEIKPFANAYTCVREGIGQLFDYMHREETKKKKCIVIVGPNAPEERDLKFINELRTVLNVPFSYLSFDEKKMTAIEY
jgi:hypothetical protein